MINTKRILAFLLMSVVLITCAAGLTACGGNTPGTSSDETSDLFTATSADDVSSEMTDLTTSEAASDTASAAQTTSAAVNTNTSQPTAAASQAAAKPTGATTPQGKKYEPAAKSLSGTVTFSGSTSVYPAVAALREAFIKLYPNVKVSITNVTGSGAGLTDANAKRVSFGMRSSAWDQKTADANPNITPFSIALDGVAIVVNKSNTAVGNITNDQLAKLYKIGPEITNWNQIGGANLAIAAVSREAGSGTRDCFETVIPGLKGTAYDSQGNVKNISSSTDAVKTYVKGNNQAIGYMSSGSVDDSVKALTFEGVVANKANVQNGSYTFQRPFLLLFNNTKALSDAEKEFLRFIYSKEGQTIIDKGGFVDLAQGSIDAELAKIK